MRIEYWGRIRFKSGSYYVTIPAGEIYKLRKHNPKLIGEEVKVEVTL